MDSTLGGSAGRIGSGGGSGSRDSPYTLGGGGASTAAWTRLVSSGVEDELFGVAGAGGGRAGVLFPPQPPSQGHFLDACFLCRKPLAGNRDIFMYRGDIPFCSEDCRREQIEMDEEMERKETTSKKVAQRASSPQGVESPPRPPKARAGSILAG